MKCFIVLVCMLAGFCKMAAEPCGVIPSFEPQFFDVDGDGTEDVRYRQDTRLISGVPNPTREALRYAVALSPARFLRSQGIQLNFFPGRMISSANVVEVISGVSEIDLTVYYNIDYGGFVDCGYPEWPNTWNALTNGIAGIRLQLDDGFHYGWIRFARPDLEPSTPFAVVDHDWNPVPGAPIGAGEPPALPALQTQLGETGLTLTWDARFPNLQLEWSESLDEPVDWHPVEDAGAGTALVPPAETHRFFRLRKL